MAIRKVIPRSLDSAAASANLSFDANTLYVDSTNNVVGINTATPNSFATGLAVYNATNPSVAIVSGNANAYLRLYSTSDSDMYLSNVGGTMTFSTAATSRMTINSSGVVSVAGNTTLGDATTDTVTVNGYMGVGGAASTSTALLVGSPTLTGTTQRGVDAATTFGTGATVSAQQIRAISTLTTAGVYADWIGINVAQPQGTGYTLTNAYGLYIQDQTKGTNNYGITSEVSSGTNKFNIYASGTAQNYFAGNVGIGTSSPDSKLNLTGTSTSSVALKITNNNATGADKYITMFAGGTSTGITAWNNSGVIESAVGDNLVFSAYNGTAIFQTGTSRTERMRIDSSGNLLVGTTTANGKLAFGNSSVISFNTSLGSTGTYAQIKAFNAIADTNPATNIRFIRDVASVGNDGAICFDTVNTEKMRIDSSGNVGIGVTTVLAGFRMEIDNGSSAGSSNHLAFTTRNTAAQVKRLYIGASGLDGSLPVYTLSTGAVGTDPAIAFAPAGTERMRVSNVGNVGIGTADPIYPLHISTAFSRAYMISTTGTNYCSYSANNGGGGFAFGIDNSAGNNFGAGAYGRVLFSDGAYPVGIFTNGTLRLTIPADAAGIKFPATQVASADANTLDDYEEGTWTPAFAFGGNSVGATYSSQTGRYTKIGNTVVISAILGLTAKGSSTGNVTITGLPFTAENYGAVKIGQFYAFTYTSGNQIYAYTGGSFITIQVTTPAGGLANMDNTSITNTTQIIFSATYRL